MSRKGDETKNQFVEVMLHQLEAIGLDKVTVTSLTRECNVNRQTFYYHFDDMHSFLQFSCHQLMEEVFDAVRATTNMEDGLRACLEEVEKNRNAYCAIIESTEYGWIRRDLLELSSEFIWSRYSQCILNEDIREKDRGFFTRMYALTIFEFAEKLFYGQAYSTLDSFIDSVETFFGDYLVKVND